MSFVFNLFHATGLFLYPLKGCIVKDFRSILEVQERTKAEATIGGGI